MLPLDLHSGMIISSRSSGVGVASEIPSVVQSISKWITISLTSHGNHPKHSTSIPMILSIFAAIKGAKELVQENGAGGYKGVVVKVCDVVVMDVCVMDVVVLDVSV